MIYRCSDSWYLSIFINANMKIRAIVLRWIENFEIEIQVGLYQLKQLTEKLIAHINLLVDTVE